MARWELTAATQAFLAGDDLPMPEAWRSRPETPEPKEATPDISLTQYEVAAVRASLLGSPIVTEEARPATERSKPLAYGPVVGRLMVTAEGEVEVCERLSSIHRTYPDQMEARRRARASVPLFGWPPRKVFAKDL